MSLSDILTRAESDGLASLKLTELRTIASVQGLKGTSGLRKGDLIAVIAAAGGRSSDKSSAAQQRGASSSSTSPARSARRDAAQESGQSTGQQDSAESTPPQASDASVHSSARGASEKMENKENTHIQHEDTEEESQNNNRNRRTRRNRRNRRGRGRDNRNSPQASGTQPQGSNQQNTPEEDGQQDSAAQRERTPEPSLITVNGILDFADANTAFIRTTGYHAGPTDVYVPMNMVRKFGMRHGDAIAGSIRPRGADTHNNNRGNRGRNRQKYTPLHSVDTINGLSPAQAAQRPHFSKLTPLYPNQRLRLETDPKVMTTRVIDLIMPIGKGQRALIVSPPKAGKTTIMQDIANAITTNSPECYLMVVLVDERPEEVTDMQRSVKGEVIASTFDRPPSEHTSVAELAVERAKRLVEQNKDVVLLLDSITRLGRAYNNSSPASGRILSGGVDSNALYPPKRFLGAARNIENGGSLTIIATAMVETGSAGDTVIFEEFKGTGNAELKLDRKIAERRVFPAVDVNPSGTRKDELLLSPEEARIMHKLRRILSALDAQAAIDLLIKQLRKNKTNREFMLQVASSAPLADEDEEGN